MARLLELCLEQSPIFADSSDVGRKFYETVTRNYGYVGGQIALWLVEMGEERIRDMISQHMIVFQNQYGIRFTGEERYWEVSIVLADLANKVAVERGWVDYDYVAATEFALEQAGMTRKSLAAQKTDEFDMLADYLNEVGHATITVMHTDGGSFSIPDAGRLPRGEVRARYDVYRKTVNAPYDRGILLVDRTHLRRWLSSRGGDWKRFCDVLADEGADATPSSKKAMLGRLTALRLPQVYVIGINLNTDRFREILNNVEGPAESMTLSQLRSVI
jgi:hypothetical protein